MNSLPFSQDETHEPSDHFFLTILQLLECCEPHQTLLLAGHSRMWSSFPDVSCDLFTIPKTPTNTGQYPDTGASILYTKTGCREFSQELRTVICLIMLLPADCQRTFLPSNILTINASNTSCKKQFLMKENLPGFRNRFSINCPAVCASLQADKKLLEVMISLFIQLKRKQTHLKSCSIVLSWENINEENTEIQDSFFLWLEVKIKQSKSKITVKTLALPFFWD